MFIIMQIFFLNYKLVCIIFLGGNILVKNWQAHSVRYVINGAAYNVPSIGIKAAVIDFTLSRVTHSKTQEPIYLDLVDDEEQFLGTGDHQFDVYRMMRDHNR